MLACELTKHVKKRLGLGGIAKAAGIGRWYLFATRGIHGKSLSKEEKAWGKGAMIMSSILAG